jgi:hypothetical protein
VVLPAARPDLPGSGRNQASMTEYEHCDPVIVADRLGG